jgi:hypothetical protein
VVKNNKPNPDEKLRTEAIIKRVKERERRGMYGNPLPESFVRPPGETRPLLTARWR